MRRMLAVLTILVGTLGFISAASPATAGAANCSAGQSYTFWNGQLNFTANLFGCTGIDAVEFRNTSGYPSLWHDGSNFNDYYATSPTGIIQMGGPGMTGASLTFSRPSWCGGAAHQVYTSYVWRIHNTANGGSWGSLFRTSSGNYVINC